MNVPEKVFYDGHGQYRYFTLHSNAISSSHKGARHFVTKSCTPRQIKFKGNIPRLARLNDEQPEINLYGCLYSLLRIIQVEGPISKGTSIVLHLEIFFGDLMSHPPHVGLKKAVCNRQPS